MVEEVEIGVILQAFSQEFQTDGWDQPVAVGCAWIVANRVILGWVKQESVSIA